MPETKITVDAILFDMDGTLIDSTAGVLAAWDYWATLYPHLNIPEVLHSSHGVRTIDNLKRWCPEIPPEDLDAKVHDFEMAIVNAGKLNEAEGRSGIIMLPGVVELLKQLEGLDDHWAICTSATTYYATAALNSLEISIPKAFVTADDVPKGKPYPDPYLLGAVKCGADPKRCLVVEDAPSGIASGKAAGSKVLAVLTSHTEERMRKTEPDFLLADLTGFSVKRTVDGIEVTIRD